MYEHKAAATVLRNIRVIGIDQRLESKAGEAVVAHTATFEVTPKQSEGIALASEIGKVALTLRSLVPAPGEPAAGDKVAEATPGSSPEFADCGKRNLHVRQRNQPAPAQTGQRKGAIPTRGHWRGHDLARSGKKEDAKASEPASKGS